jgi:hypothetical protein
MQSITVAAALCRRAEIAQTQRGGYSKKKMPDGF